jgi:hypothetical protein
MALSRYWAFSSNSSGLRQGLPYNICSRLRPDGSASASAATSAVIVSVGAHCPTSSAASAPSVVSVASFGEVTNRLSNPLGSVHHGKMARLIAGNGRIGRSPWPATRGLAGK